MLVHILSAFPAQSAELPNFASSWLRQSALEDPFGRHWLTDNPEEADLILFVEAHPGTDPFLLGVRHHPLFRRYPGKCFLYHDADMALPVMRGIYPSIRRRDYQPERCRSGGYIARIAQNESVQYDLAPIERTWLYSFFGEANAEIRRALFARGHPHGMVRDTTGRRHWQMPEGPERQAFTSEFAASIRQSRFVLCPAGLGPCSYRLFETMEMGRVPVILSNEWVPIAGPRWEDFSVQIPENRVNDLETILADHAPRYEEMGRQARAAWEQYFAKPVCFHRMSESCAEIMAECPTLFSAIRPRLKLCREPYRRIWLRPKYRKLRARLSFPGPRR